MFDHSSNSIYQVATSLGMGYLLTILGLILSMQILQNGAHSADAIAPHSTMQID
jgi:hypothetical protein